MGNVGGTPTLLAAARRGCHGLRPEARSHVAQMRRGDHLRSVARWARNGVMVQWQDMAGQLSKSVWQDAKHSRQDAGAPPRDAAALGRIGGDLEKQVG